MIGSINLINQSILHRVKCFVFTSSIAVYGVNQVPYKDQNGIEHNFSFLKDPVLVNAIFLKRPERIEALGVILVLSLLLWRLIELRMRQYLEQHQTELPGWDNKPTTRPTTFMMTTKFQGIQVLKLGQRRWLARKLSEVHKRYLAALGLTSLVFTQVVSADPSP